MLKKVFNWLHDTTIAGDHMNTPSAYNGVGSMGNEEMGFKNSKPQYETMKAVLYMGVR